MAVKTKKKLHPKNLFLDRETTNETFEHKII